MRLLLMSLLGVAIWCAVILMAAFCAISGFSLCGLLRSLRTRDY